MENGGFALHCANIRELARQMLMMRVARGFSMPYRDGCPGHNWLAGFLKRHPGNVIFCEQFSTVLAGLFRQSYTSQAIQFIYLFNMKFVHEVH